MDDQKEKFKLELAKGVRDFPPEEKIIRDGIIKTIIESFELYGFNPIETPIIERWETLAAKFAAGEESDAMKETFKLTDQGNRSLALRFDLTVPFCRFVGMNPALKMPFKKYLIGEVFRDGPLKKGRYREFMQMDPDIVGASTMLADAEILSLAETVFRKLGFEITIELNNRKILDGIMEELSIPEGRRFDVIVSIDKLKKIGEEGVAKELTGKGLSDAQIKKILDCFRMESTNKKTVDRLMKIIKSPKAGEGLKEIDDLLTYLELFGSKDVRFDPTLARGLAYYTGPVFEIFLKGSSITSSAAGGGRYDKIIGNYLQTEKSFPATGISFGVEVIIEAMKEKQKLTKRSVVEAYIIPIGKQKECIPLVQRLRNAGIKTDFDIMGRGISKNLEFANAYNLPYVIFVGEDELKAGKFKLREMQTGKEEMLSEEELIKKLR